MADVVPDISLISKAKPPLQSMDYAFLREEGIKYIQSLATKLWTDHNIHDPGITILEALIYGITDLGARANKPIQDLLASKPGAGATEKDFFSAAEILPCSPVTLNDFRKILIDHAKIRNAWLSRSQDSELPVFLNVALGSLSYIGNKADEISINGLYQVLIEFEEDEALGDLNNSIISREITISGISQPHTIEVALPFWDELQPFWSSDFAITGIEMEEQGGGKKLRPLGPDHDHDYFALLDIKDNLIVIDQIGVTIKITSKIQQPAIELPLIESAIQNKLTETGQGSIIREYQNKIIAVNILLAEVKKYINGNRNLCEDFYTFKTSRIQEIAVNTSLELNSRVDVIQTLSEMFYRLDKFFSPSIRFYTLQEMLAKPGMTADRIFEGPILKNGFIDENELEELKRAETIYTSDLVRIIVNADSAIPTYANQNKKIIAVKDFAIANYINNQKITDNVKNCLKLTYTDIYKPRLSINKSMVKVFKDSIEVEYDIIAVIETFNALMAADKVLSADVSFDLEIPVGNTLFVEEYYSIRNNFPLTYGIGEAGLSDSVSEQRKAQAKQLKGFLLFFEQFLVDYLSQLAHVKDLFSINTGIDKTYFWQQLTGVPGVTQLIGSSYPGTVQSFIDDQLEQLSSPNHRRNHFLDHLLSRFGEDFTDFALLKYSMAKDDLLPANNELAVIKSTFLKEYDNISYNRAKSFNFLGRDRLDYFTISATGGIPPKYSWKLTDESSNILLVNFALSTEIDQVNKTVSATAILGKYRSNYQIINSGVGKRSLQLTDPESGIIARSMKEFLLDSDVETEITVIIDFLVDVWNTGNVPWLKRRVCSLLEIGEYRQINLATGATEGFHMVENILLRPKVNDSGSGKSDLFLNIGLDSKGNVLEGERDPYSFKLTFLFPGWIGRFADAKPEYRRFVEKVIQRETPAHILAEVYWLELYEMVNFESAYKDWLTANATEKDPSLLTDIKNKFIKVLNDVTNLLTPSAI